MRRHLLWIALMVGVPAVVSAQPAPDAAALKREWKKHCRDCHGDDGRGRPAKAKMLKVEPRLLDLTRAENFTRSREYMLKILVEGKDAMPGFKAKLKPPMMNAMLDMSMQIIDNAKRAAGTKPKS